ncbi:hypothetical protein CVT25_009660 [Psilocybe cyanescens]|uniref:Uncharacterized protein n=1 Tax=Psilocybe cyanescens TaxID=93625 RepID=A0A409XGZ6_PSICY|nr:hypothetical protein CVT25_009660 [Psilocybe cyanescens]
MEGQGGRAEGKEGEGRPAQAAAAVFNGNSRLGAGGGTAKELALSVRRARRSAAYTGPSPLPIQGSKAYPAPQISTPASFPSADAYLSPPPTPTMPTPQQNPAAEGAPGNADEELARAVPEAGPEELCGACWGVLFADFGAGAVGGLTNEDGMRVVLPGEDDDDDEHQRKASIWG